MAAIRSFTARANSIWERWSAVPAGLRRSEERFYAYWAVVIPPAWLLHLIYIFLFAYWGVWPLAIFNIFSVIIWTTVIVFWKRQRLNLVTALGILEVLTHSTLVIVYIGWAFGAQYFIFNTFVGVVLNTLYQRRSNLGFGVLFTLIFIGWYYYTVFFPPLVSVPPLSLALVNIINIIALFVMIGATTTYLVDEAERANKANEELLNNVLPGPIAARLKRKPVTIADGFQNASILFADIAGFTPVSRDLTPDELVEMLDAIFSRFDELVDLYGLEKIKTIGDEYMVASGIPIPREDHAEALASFALAMRDSLAEYCLANNIDLQMRIGLNSGPVVAGVIGKRRFLYDLWGDSVNTASRMESHGLPGEIQVTAATRDLLGAQFRFVERGVIDVKGKGPMQTYFLQGNGHG